MFKRMTLAALLAATLGGAHAADPDELAAIRAQIEALRQAYEQRIATLEQKLAQAEARTSAALPQAPAAAPEASRPALPAVAGNQFNPEVSLILQGQYRQQQAVAERGITGFWPAGSHAHGDGAAEGDHRRGFSMDHTELVLAASIDPFWRGQAILAALDGQTEVEEAWFQSTGLGHGLGLKAGRFRSGVGYLNEQHPHQWDFAGAPLMYQAMFGEHGSYAQDGLQLKWLAPTPWFLELGAEIGRGATFPGNDRNRNGSGAAALFAHVGGDVGDEHGWRAGLSYLGTRTTAREADATSLGLNDHAPVVFAGRSRTWLADFVWKWAPDGNPKYRNFKFQAEYFSRQENGELGCYLAAGICDAESVAGASLAGLDGYRRRQSGAYAQAVYQFTPNWRAGLRVEQLRSGTAQLGDGVTAQVDPDSALFARYRPRRDSAMVDYSWSEFSRVRLQYAQDRSMAGITDHQWTLQYIMSLGAHGAHKF